MLIASLLSGGILIICGFLVKQFPDLIAGYNTLSKEEKKKINIEKLSSMMKKALIIIGSLTATLGLVAYFSNIKEYLAMIAITSVIIIGIIIMVIMAEKHKYLNK